jgi:hypothetical protein
MPNWCSSDLAITGSSFAINSLLDRFETEANSEEKVFSFEKIHPTPASLNIDNAYNAEIIAKLIKKLNKDSDIINLLGSDSVLTDEVKSILNNSVYEDYFNAYVINHINSDSLDLVKVAKDLIILIKNYESYGHFTWYEWRIENWGTKWNCDSSVIDVVKMKNNKLKLIVGLETAWSPPIALLVKLSEQFPALEIRISYYEGGAGYKGKNYIKEGSILSDKQSSYRGSRGG